MKPHKRPQALVALMPLALLLAGCATTYTSDVEVTRFVAEQPASLAAGGIELRVDADEEFELLSSPYERAIASELTRLGYATNSASEPGQVAIIKVERRQFREGSGNSPVSVGVGGGTGSFNSGVGLGVGFNLGGGPKDRVATRVSVRISERSEAGETLWEGRADIVTSPDSPYAEAQANAQTLAKALFRDFPGGNGETITIDVTELQDTQ